MYVVAVTLFYCIEYDELNERLCEVNLDYLKYVLKPVFRELKKDASVQMVKMNTYHYPPLYD